MYTLFKESPRAHSGYVFGNIRSIEPILDGVRKNTSGENGEYVNKETYQCDSFGYAALRITLENVKASWDDAPSVIVLDVDAGSLIDLSTSPCIQQKSHALQWSTSEGKSPRFPQIGDRIGMYAYGRAHGDNFGSHFRNVVSVAQDGSLSYHVKGDCSRFDKDTFVTEEDALSAMHANPDLAELDRSTDYTWDATSVCPNN